VVASLAAAVVDAAGVLVGVAAGVVASLAAVDDDGGAVGPGTAHVAPAGAASDVEPDVQVGALDAGAGAAPAELVVAGGDCGGLVVAVGVAAPVVAVVGVAALAALVGAAAAFELAGAGVVAAAGVVVGGGAVDGETGAAGAVPSATRDGWGTASCATATSARTPKQATGVAATRASPTPLLTHRNPANWIVRVPLRDCRRFPDPAAAVCAGRLRAPGPRCQ
jgi:hypothetical protein